MNKHFFLGTTIMIEIKLFMDGHRIRNPQWPPPLGCRIFHSASYRKMNRSFFFETTKIICH